MELPYSDSVLVAETPDRSLEVVRDHLTTLDKWQRISMSSWCNWWSIGMCLSSSFSILMSPSNFQFTSPHHGLCSNYPVRIDQHYLVVD